MAFATQVSALLLVFLAVCIKFHEAQFIPGARCLCPTTIKFIPDAIADFQVIEKGPNCDRTELIVTLKKPEGSKEEIKKCLNTDGKLAKAFLHCWNNIKRDESKKMTCVNRRNKKPQ